MLLRSNKDTADKPTTAPSEFQTRFFFLLDRFCLLLRLGHYPANGGAAAQPSSVAGVNLEVDSKNTMFNRLIDCNVHV
jgi:hypothetical protein